MIWKDCTSYRRDERERGVEPRTYEATFGKIVVTLTKHVHHGDEWTLRCPQLGIGVSINVGLGTSDLPMARKKAALAVMKEITSLRRDLSAAEVAMLKEARPKP